MGNCFHIPKSLKPNKFYLNKIIHIDTNHRSHIDTNHKYHIDKNVASINIDRLPFIHSSLPYTDIDFVNNATSMRMHACASDVETQVSSCHSHHSHHMTVSANQIKDYTWNNEEKTMDLQNVKYDPYHCCEGGWYDCCQKNLDLQIKVVSFKLAFDKRYAKKYSTRYSFTYKHWIWYKEFFFEELIPPARLWGTDCGLCPNCIYYKGRKVCFFPQEFGTYKAWYDEKRKDWL